MPHQYLFVGAIAPSSPLISPPMVSSIVAHGLIIVLFSIIVDYYTVPIERSYPSRSCLTFFDCLFTCFMH